MKVRLIIFFTLSVLCNISVHAELKHFLPHSGGFININVNYGCSTAKYSFEGDTIINNKEYIKVYSQEYNFENDCDKDSSYYAAVRQDTIGEKIYVILESTEEEKLLADFNVEEGDFITAHLFPFDGWSKEVTEVLAYVASVDSILIDDEYRKRVHIATVQLGTYTGLTNDWWVEGIGSVRYGLFYPCTRGDDAAGFWMPTFLCLHTDEDFIYQNPQYNTCYLYDCEVGIYENEISNFIIYPGFIDQYLSVKKNTEQSFTYQIYNIQGINVQSGVLKGDQINVSNLNAAMYCILFYDKNNKKVYSSTFVKQ